ncbi:hypothetical protein [Streptomyces nigrescens]|uniref:hypothetical protein n=1 Tax=Streptomyces nigrescens TaxID=1920 RepID=UPI00348C1EEB
MNDNGTSLSWSAGWTAAVQRPSEGFHKNWAQDGFADQTVRQIVRVTGSGTSARIKLSHRYGTAPLELAGATIALTDKGGGRAGRLGAPAHLRRGPLGAGPGG